MFIPVLPLIELVRYSDTHDRANMSESTATLGLSEYMELFLSRISCATQWALIIMIGVRKKCA